MSSHWLKPGLTVFFIAFIVAGVVWTRNFSDGTAEVVAPPSSALALSIDGKGRLELAGGAQRSVSVPRGKHQLTVERGGEKAQYELEIVDGLSRFLLTAPGQCMVHINLSNSYAPEGQKASPPIIERRQKPAEGSSLSGNVYLPGVDPPTIGQKGARIIAIREVDCALLTLDDAEIFERLSF